MIATLKGACPDPKVLVRFEHQIAYERTQETYPLQGLSLIHAHVWIRGPITGIYIRDQLKAYATGPHDLPLRGR